VTAQFSLAGICTAAAIVLCAGECDATRAHQYFDDQQPSEAAFSASKIYSEKVGISFSDISFAATLDLLVACADDNGQLIVWDASTKKVKTRFVGDKNGVMCVSFSPDGRYLYGSLSVSKDGGMKVKKWSVENHEELFALAVDAPPYKIAVAPSGKLFAVGVGDKAVQVRDAQNGKLVWDLEPKSGFISGVAFSSDGKHLATAHHPSFGSKVETTALAAKIWDLGSGKEIRSLKRWSERVGDKVAFSPCGKWLAVSDGEKIKIWNTQTGDIDHTVLFARAGTIFQLCYHPNGKWLAVGHSNLGIVIHETQGYKQVATLPGARRNGLAINGKGNLLACFGLGEVQIWEIATPKSAPDKKAGPKGSKSK
jgi:WD40 repeat protein